MMSEKKGKSQSQKFRDLAHEVECDEDESTFDDKLKRISKVTEEKTTPKPTLKSKKVSHGKGH